MASTRSQKEKNTLGSTPRLTPRSTAASAARAAKYSTNRNVNVQPSERPSPTRSQTSSSSFKVKSPPLRNTPKVDTKPEAKAIRVSEPEHNVDNFVVLSKPRSDTFLTDHTSTVIIEESSEERINYDRADNVESLMCDGNRSRPYSPLVNSRPATPRNVSSRPHTPHRTSRPRTPAHPAQRCTTPIHQVQTPPRIQTPNKQLNSPVCGRGQLSSSPRTPPLAKSRPQSPVKIEDMKAAYNVKQKQYNLMKKELDLKQQAVLEAFDCLRGMQERMRREGVSGGGEGFQEQELVIFNVGDWSTNEITQLCRDAAASSCADGAVELINTTVPIDESTLSELDAKIVDVPDRFANLCLQAMKGRQEIIDWLKTLVEINDDGSGESIQRVGRYNEEGKELCELLKELKDEANNSVLTALQLSKRAFRERNALIVVGESLVREIARLRQDFKTPAAIVNDDNEVKQKLETLQQELDVEKEANAALKEKLTLTESQLRNARARINKMDRQLREADSSIASLTGTVKSLEDQSRQKEVQLEARARKLKESLKTGEITSSQLAQQRDALQAEISDLKEQIEVMTNQHKSALTKINDELKDCERALEEQEKITQNELKAKEEIAAKLAESQIIIEDLKEKNTKLENSLPNPDLPTEKEMHLWAELQATKETLRTAEEEITICKREKVRFLETLTNITGSDNKVGLQQKLAAELMSKEEIMGNMQMQIRELTKSIKLNEQKVIQYEQYVHDLHAHNKALDGTQDNVNVMNYEELQKDVMSLKISLLEAVHRNEELSEMLMKRDQQIEQQEKTSRAQARVLKVREELISMLKNNETEQSRELTALQKDLEHRMKIVDEANRQIAAKADEIQELFTTLENKQQQIHRLEKIVLSLDEQQRRAQAQRTKHEEKIAALEHELDSVNGRYRRFLFF